MQFLHDDVILEIWITPEMEADSEAHFVVLERLNLKTEEMVEFIYTYIYIYITIIMGKEMLHFLPQDQSCN